MSADVLALVVEDAACGYLVIDSRCGRPVSWHGDLGDANGTAVYLNSTYPIGVDDLSSGKFCAPARDTLIYELVERRVGDEAPICLETWWMLNAPSAVAVGSGDWCPWGVPIGPGWDHIHEEVRR